MDIYLLSTDGNGTAKGQHHAFFGRVFLEERNQVVENMVVVLDGNPLNLGVGKGVGRIPVGDGCCVFWIMVDKGAFDFLEDGGGHAGCFLHEMDLACLFRLEHMP